MRTCATQMVRRVRIFRIMRTRSRRNFERFMRVSRMFWGILHVKHAPFRVFSAHVRKPFLVGSQAFPKVCLWVGLIVMSNLLSPTCYTK